MGIELPPLPESGLPKFRMPLPNINYARLITNAVFIYLIEEGISNEMMFKDI